MKARDLDPARTVFRSPTGTVLHLDEDCARLSNADTYPTTAGVQFGDKDVCGRCVPRDAGDFGGVAP